MLEVVDDFTVGYGGEEENRDQNNECSAQMSGAWNRAPDIAQQSQWIAIVPLVRSPVNA